MSCNLNIVTPMEPLNIEENTVGVNESFWLKFQRFHVKHELKDISAELIVLRGVALLLWLSCAVIDTVAYSSVLDSLPAKLFFGLKAPLYDVATVLYASSSATFGVGYEIYVLLPLAITNFILTLFNCDERQKLYTGLWLLKIVCLFVAVQSTYYNFTKITSYADNFLKATSYMMRHALIFTVTMIFLMTPGLQAVYDSVMGKCSYTIGRCNVIELYEPLFNDSDRCKNSYTQYIVGREELRILRDFLLIHIVSYAIYNQSFLTMNWQWSNLKITFHNFARLLLLLVFIFMSISAVVANMIPFEFPKSNIKLIFDITEFIIFFIGILLLVLNLLCKRLQYRSTSEMNKKPDITVTPN